LSGSGGFPGLLRQGIASETIGIGLQSESATLQAKLGFCLGIINLGMQSRCLDLEMTVLFFDKAGYWVIV
jgi:hypothetical protein